MRKGTVIYIYIVTPKRLTRKILGAKTSVNYSSTFLGFAMYSIDSIIILFVWPFGGFPKWGYPQSPLVHWGIPMTMEIHYLPLLTIIKHILPSGKLT